MLTIFAAAVLLAYSTPQGISRRAVIGSGVAVSFLPVAAAVAADSEAAVLAEIKDIRSKLDVAKINKLLEEEQWDQVRSIFKVPPVNLAWEQQMAKKNPFRRLADLRDDVEQFELVDELAAALQLAECGAMARSYELSAGLCLLCAAAPPCFFTNSQRARSSPVWQSVLLFQHLHLHTARQW